MACGHAWKKKKGIPFYPQLSSCGCRQHLSTGGMRASHCGWGAEGSTRRSGGHIHVTKQTPPVEGNSYCHAIRHFGATKQLQSSALQGALEEDRQGLAVSAQSQMLLIYFPP